MSDINTMALPAYWDCQIYNSFIQLSTVNLQIINSKFCIFLSRQVCKMLSNNNVQERTWSVLKREWLWQRNLFTPTVVMCHNPAFSITSTTAVHAKYLCVCHREQHATITGTKSDSPNRNFYRVHPNGWLIIIIPRKRICTQVSISH